MIRTPRLARAGRTRATMPHLDAGPDRVVCRLRTLIIVGTAVALGASVGILLGSGRPVPGWKWAMVALLILPAVRTTMLPVLIGLADLLMIYIVSWPGLGGWTSVAVLGLHTAAVSWFLGSTVAPSAELHVSALRRIAARWGWVQAVAQIGVLVAIGTAGLTSDRLIGALGVLALLGLVLAITVASTASRPGGQRPSGR